MSCQRYALIVLLSLGLPSAVCAQLELAPQVGVLVLRNGQVLTGGVTRAGDLYVVTLGENAEIRQPAADVEVFCASLDEAYDFKKDHLAGAGVRPHLDLAEWCLRHNMHAHCAEQLVAAMRISPDDERLLQLERRLKFAAESPAASPPPAASNESTVSAQQLEETLRALPKGSVEKFSSTIQPILLNRCAANQCHGPNTKSQYSLLRPPEGQIASRRFTQRNLYATLRYLSPSDPESSPFVTKAQQRHGPALTAVFDKHTQNQLAELVGWAKLAVASSPPPAPRTIGTASTTLSQPAAADRPPPAKEDAKGASPAAAAAPAAGSIEVKAMRPPLEPGNEARPAGGGERFVPRDRFDPEIFNRRYHK